MREEEQWNPFGVREDFGVSLPSPRTPFLAKQTDERYCNGTTMENNESVGV